MTNPFWRKSKPSKKQVSQCIWFFDELENLTKQMEEMEETEKQEEEEMLQDTIINRACVVLNDLEVLTSRLMNVDLRRQSSPEKIIDVRKSYSYEGDFECKFNVIYNPEDDEITDPLWYVENKTHVYNILKEWVSEQLRWKFVISELDHTTDFEVGVFEIVFTIKVTR